MRWSCLGRQLIGLRQTAVAEQSEHLKLREKLKTAAAEQSKHLKFGAIFKKRCSRTVEKSKIEANMKMWDLLNG